MVVRLQILQYFINKFYANILLNAYRSHRSLFIQFIGAAEIWINTEHRIIVATTKVEFVVTPLGGGSTYAFLAIDMLF